MRRMRRFLLGVSLTASLGALLYLHAGNPAFIREGQSVTPTGGQVSTPNSVRNKKSVELVRSYERLPLSFEPNIGQADTRTKFLARGSGYEVFLTAGGAVLGLHAPSRGGSIHPVTLRMELAGANPASTLFAVQRLPGKSNYLIGDRPQAWHTNIPTYRRVKQDAIYPGIDVVYYGTQRQLEYDFVVAPGADPSLIRLRMEGSDALRVNSQGDLIASVAGAEMRFKRPVAYQLIAGEQRSIAVDYVRSSARTVGFKVAEFNPKQALIIDPILSYSTYLGGSNIDGANAIAVAPDNTAFIAGGTFSLDFPTAHPLQPNHGGPDDFSRDAFVAKLSADGSTLLYSTYLGGEFEDVANGIAVDTFGDAYVTGTTLSPHFPVTPGSFNPECGGDGKCGASFNTGGLIVSNGFVTKLNPAGSAIVYSGFIGSFENVKCFGIAVDKDQIAYVTGQTEANGVSSLPIPAPPAPPPPQPPPFPITATAFQPSFGGGATDAFVLTISATGSDIQYSSYLGGSGEDVAYGIAVDSSANAYLTGLTYSVDFPTRNALQGAVGGAGDAFVTKVNTRAAGPASLLYSTYLGGSGLDQGNGVAVDSSGDAYVTGGTASKVSTLGFTTPPGAFQPDCALDSSGVCEGDAYVAKLNPAQSGPASLVYFTYLGGKLGDSGTGITVDPITPPSGNVYVTGNTVSSDFPVTSAAFQSKFGGGNADAFVAKLDSAGANLVYSSYLGGTNTDIGYGIAADTSGNAYVAGQTCSLDFPMANPLQNASGGNCDAFISKVSILSGIQVNPAGLVFSAQSLGTTSQSQTVTVTNGDNPVTLAPIAIDPTSPNAGDFNETTTCGSTLNPGGLCTITVTFSPQGAGIRKASIILSYSTLTLSNQNLVLNLNGQSSTLTLSASNLSFGQQQVGTTSTNPLAITATNNGTTAVTFTGITASGDFNETENCTKAPLQPGTNCVINVTYTPSTAGASLGSLTLADNAPGSPQIVLLSGTGFGQQSDFALSATPSSASVPAGKSATYTLQLSSVGGFNQPVSVSCQGLPSGANCLLPSNGVIPSEPASVTLTVATATRASAPPIWRIRLAPNGQKWNYFSATVLTILILLLAIGRMNSKPSVRHATVLFSALVASILLVAACNSGGQANVPAGTPAGAYQITVMATSGSITHSITVGLQVN
jgi:hypothetical protein